MTTTAMTIMSDLDDISDVCNRRKVARVRVGCQVPRSDVCTCWYAKSNLLNLVLIFLILLLIPEA